MIKVMDEILANKIKAGEVVEKCVSVVKELVENSIDAKATQITINLITSGTKRIQVVDNGIGMNKEDAKICFLRHATSKIIDYEDLYSIETLGFRGEALPSIAAVSNINLQTSDKIEGTSVLIEGGKIIEISNSNLRLGTIITVDNLFYNTPARLKYLSSLQAQLANIIAYVNKAILSHPYIKFTLTNDDKTLITSIGDNNLLKAINSVYGLEVTKKMLEIKAENNDYSIEGYISYPEVQRSTKEYITMMINGRIVKNFDVIKTINEAYHTYKPENKYPIVVLNIITDASLVDVNIHPTKMDVKFSKLDVLKDLITTTIKNRLESIMLIPSILETKKEASINSSLYSFNNNTLDNNLGLNNQISQPIYNTTNIEPLVDFNITNQVEDIKKEQPIKYEVPRFDFNMNIKEEENTYNNETIEEDNEELITQVVTRRGFNFDIVGLVHATYIVCQNHEGMFLIDQHAACERVNYEIVLEKLGSPTSTTTKLLVPIVIEYPLNEFMLIKDKIPLIHELGIKIEEFGLNSYSIKEVPTWLPKNNEERAIRSIIDIILRKDSFDKKKFNEAIAIMMSCKMSIKANDNISIDEMRTLINNLEATNNPWTCPHGRPTIIKWTNYELEKLFKRSV